MGKRAKVLDQPMKFKSTEYTKFIDAAADSVLQRTSKKLPLTEFWCGIEEKYP